MGSRAMYDTSVGKLFISHAAHDKPLVEALVDLLEGGVGVPHRDVFCSSLKGQSIKPGEDFVDSIRQNLDEATCAMVLISEAYYASAFCMCELGGVWLQSKSCLPVLIPPVDHTNLKAVLGGIQVSKIGSVRDLDELRDELVKRLAIEGYSTPRWNDKCKAFLEALPALLEKIRFTGPVARPAHEKVVKELADYRREYEASQAEVTRLNNLVDKLSELKDAPQVAEVVRGHSTAIENFETLATAAAAAIQPLHWTVREALYQTVRGDHYYPKDNWDEVQGPIEYGQLRLNADENGVLPDEKDPKVRKAIEALDGLAGFLGSSLPDEFLAWYRAEANDERPDIGLRS